MGLDRIDALARCLKHAVNIAVGAGTNDVVACWRLKGERRERRHLRIGVDKGDVGVGQMSGWQRALHEWMYAGGGGARLD